MYRVQPTHSQKTSAELISNRLLQEIVIPYKKSIGKKVKDYPTFSGPLKKRVDGMLEKRNAQRLQQQLPALFEHFYYKKFIMKNVSGRKFLDVLRTICRDKDLIKPRTCIVISIHNSDEAGVVVYNEDWLEITTPPLSGNDRGYYRKLFDDVKCKKRATSRPEKYGEDAVCPLREDFTDIFTNFFSKPVMETSEPYRHACYGLLIDIAKLELESPLCLMMRNLPVAALIWMAVFNGIPHKLQSLLGDHHLFENPATPGISKEKFALRTEAAYIIVVDALSMGLGGEYDDEKLKSCVQKMQSFYGIPPPPIP